MNAPAGPVMADERREALRERLRALGFDEVRFAAVSAEAGGGLQAWIADGMHGDMAWMERTAEKRLHPGQVLAGTRSVIMLGVNYWHGTPEDKSGIQRTGRFGRGTRCTRIIMTR